MNRKEYLNTEFICNLLNEGAMLATEKMNVGDITKRIKQFLHYYADKGVDSALLASAEKVIELAISINYLNTQQRQQQQEQQQYEDDCWEALSSIGDLDF